MKGALITVEGIDGAGKTTVCNRLYDYMMRKGYKVELIREPGGTQIGERIRNILLDKNSLNMNRITELLLYIASRAQLISEKVMPLLMKDYVIICDRFIDSTYAYQGYARGFNFEMLQYLNNLSLQGISPDLTVFLDIKPEIALIRKKGNEDRFELENLDFHQKVYQGYKELEMLFPERIKRVDAERDLEVIISDVICLVESYLNER